MTLEKAPLKDGTVFYRAALADGYPLRIEVRKSTEKDMQGRGGAPPFIAIVADGKLEPTCAPGETAQDAALEVIDRLNHRYRYAAV